MKHVIFKISIGIILGLTPALTYCAMAQKQEQQVNFLREQLDRGTLSDVVKQTTFAEMAQAGNIEALKLLLDRGVKPSSEMVKKIKEAVKFKSMPNRAQIFELLDKSV